MKNYNQVFKLRAARNSLTLARRKVHVFKNTLDHLNGCVLNFLIK